MSLICLICLKEKNILSIYKGDRLKEREYERKPLKEGL
jgi:hypothetical protein